MVSTGPCVAQTKTFLAQSLAWSERKYLRLAAFCRKIVNSDTFTGFIITNIFIACVIIGMRTYPHFKESDVLSVLDYVTLSVFCLEIVLKIIGHGRRPLAYFIGRDWCWNWFDVIVVLVSLPYTPFGGRFKSLRLLRVLRLSKLFNWIPELRLIVRGLVGTMSFVAYIVLLWAIVIFMYAIAGILMFGDNDPWHFRSIELACMTLVQLTVMDVSTL